MKSLCPFFTLEVGTLEFLVIHRESNDVHIDWEDWYSDTAIFKVLAIEALLYAIDVLEYHGDTLFPSQTKAHELLPERMKRMFVDLKVISSDHCIAGSKTIRNQCRATKSQMNAERIKTVSAPPVVCTHPETGREGLYCDRLYSIKFEGAAEDECHPLLDFLMDWERQPKFARWFRWRKGPVTVWDNRCFRYIAVDYSHQERPK